MADCYSDSLVLLFVTVCFIKGYNLYSGYCSNN